MSNDKGNSFALGNSSHAGSSHNGGNGDSMGGCIRPDCMPQIGNPCGYCIGNR
jgi:hypothetical protein